MGKGKFLALELRNKILDLYRKDVKQVEILKRLGLRLFHET